MKNINFKKLLPHIIAVAVFLLVAVIFCKPALESDVVMQQGDFTASEAMKHQSVEYAKAHGNYPLWTTNMFCGMPAFQIFFTGPWSPMGIIDKIFQLGLPKPLNFFFLSCICFYFLCICLRVNSYAGIMGSLAFAYSTYSPIIAVAGHDTKLLALAYAPALIGAIILIFDKKYIPGFVLTALFATLHLMQNHQQISFYTLIIIAVMTIFYLVRWIKAKEIGHASKALTLALAGALFAVLVNAVILFPVIDYAKDTKRGGQLVMDNKINKSDNVIKEDKTTGLTKEYAFQWSYGKAETMSLLFPGVMGYGSHTSPTGDPIFPALDEDSKLGTYFSEKLNVPATNARGFSGALYWGDQPFTMGPVYLGAAACFLFILGMFLLDGKHKWWILTACILSILMAWGKNFSAFNYFLFDHLPFYNKFRTPSMALVIPQLLVPLLAVLTVGKLIDGDYNEGWKKFKLSAVVMAGIFIVAGAFYFSLDYSKENKQRTSAVNDVYSSPDASAYAKMQTINNQYQPSVDNEIYENVLNSTKGDAVIAKGVVSALRKDRQSFFGKDILMALLFVSLTGVLIALYIGKKINTAILLIGLPLLVLVDLLPMGMNYLNEKVFVSKEENEANEFPMSDADKMILSDKDPNFRVFNTAAGDPFQDSKTSYYHKSIGGYHPAKLGIYDDLITYQLSGQPNPAVINMLNTKYVIQRNQQTNAPVALQNPGALGNCWFVKGVKYVSSPVEEMKALNNFNPADTAVIDNSFKNAVGNFSAADSSASIKETSFDNDDIKYTSNSSSANLAVFSEIFYKDWKAYIDGKEVPIAKANYVLRALAIPAGQHTIEFKFEPKVYKISYTISLIAIWTLMALLIWFGYYSLVKKEE